MSMGRVARELQPARALERHVNENSSSSKSLSTTALRWHLLASGLLGLWSSCAPLDGSIATARMESGVSQHTQGIGLRSLGATYDATQSNITFRVYSSRATRITVSLYSQAQGAQEKVSYV